MRTITLSINKLLSSSLGNKSDTVGVFASGLCMLHCLATPFFFLASACNLSCCSTAPIWWQWIDYAFLGISFFAILQSTKTMTKNWVKNGLWINWIFLFLVIMNVQLQYVHLAENIKFLPAFTLVFLHTYNMRYCKCESKECCS